MKKLMTLMLGLALVTTCVTVSFAQDKTGSTTKKKTKKKKGDTTGHTAVNRNR